MTDLPDRTNITHDDCSTIIAAWRNGRLIDSEDINYQAATDAYNNARNPGAEEASFKGIIAAVDAALGLDGWHNDMTKPRWRIGDVFLITRRTNVHGDIATTEQEIVGEPFENRPGEWWYPIRPTGGFNVKESTLNDAALVRREARADTETTK